MKIGIMTMHRVQNIGSVLQAYALQYKIRQLGFDSELIDYVFPPKQKEHFNLKSVASWCFEALQGFPGKRRQSKLETFRKDYLCCSDKTYNRKDLLSSPPLYDIYCTGSDQVWNPFHVGEDTSFMMDFAPIGIPRIAYASSFASKVVQEPFYTLYAKKLSDYSAITVREKSGAVIVKSMTGKDAAVVCDPTLLLKSTEWQTVAEASTIKMPKQYILIYLLRYMFDPRPYFYSIVDVVRKSLNIPVFQINPYTQDSFQHNIKKLNGVGPADFVKLIKDASFVITDSFHGAAFASIFNVPMIGVVKDEHNGDGRIATLRSTVGGENSIICYKNRFEMKAEDVDRFRCDVDRLCDLRKYSSSMLEQMILNNHN